MNGPETWSVVSTVQIVRNLEDLEFRVKVGEDARLTACTVGLTSLFQSTSVAST